MNGKLLLIGIAVLAVVSALGWTARHLLRDPLADLGPSPTPGSTKKSEHASTATEDQPGAALSSGYVGSQACAECHAEICNSYQSHPMSHSMSLATNAPTEAYYSDPAPFNAPGPAGSDVRFQYQVSREGGQVLHHERAYDAAGNLLCSRSVPMHYAVGSGKRGHSYFHDAGGYLYMSPITWYTGGARWDRSPGYDKSNEHFERRVQDGCVFCHVGRSSPVADSLHMFEREPFHELSIGCERCHGPGAEHVTYQRKGTSSDWKTDPIVNPQKLDQPLRNDVCLQCHLQGLQRVPHPDRREFEFRPGQAIADVWTSFIRGTKIAEDNTTQAVGQAEQMLASRCYTQSQGAMSCTSCHDPHSSPTEQTRLEFYRSKCLACHGDGDDVGCLLPADERLAKSAADSCIDCHMPRLDANDVPHTSQTDHRVVRTPGQSAENQSGDAIVIYESDRIPQDIVDRATGIFFTDKAEATDDRSLSNRAVDRLAPWVREHPDDDEAMAALGTAYSLAGDTKPAISILQQTLELKPTSEYVLRRLMYDSHEIGDVENGIRYGRRLVEINPHHYEYHGRLAHMLGQAGQWDEAIDSALMAAQIRPWSAQIHGWLAEAYRITGEQQLSRKHAELYEKLDTAGRNGVQPDQ